MESTHPGSFDDFFRWNALRYLDASTREGDERLSPDVRKQLTAMRVAQ